MKGSFGDWHPWVSFVWFVEVLGFSMFLMQPVCLLLSLGCGFAYALHLKGMREMGSLLKYLLPVMLLTAVLNPAFNHEGATILTYFPSGNPLTLESILYGAASGVMLASVVLWFGCFNKIITSDKFVYLFGKAAPALSLALSMALRFVPRFVRQMKSVAQAQRCLGRDWKKGKLLHRIRCAGTILSVMMSWALENGLETADSMKSRGYGLPRRTAYSIYRFQKRDGIALLCFALLGLYVLIGCTVGALDFRWYPTVKYPPLSGYSLSVLCCMLALYAAPLILEGWEAGKWKATRCGR